SGIATYSEPNDVFGEPHFAKAQDRCRHKIGEFAVNFSSREQPIPVLERPAIIAGFKERKSQVEQCIRALRNQPVRLIERADGFPPLSPFEPPLSLEMQGRNAIVMRKRSNRLKR